MSFDKQFLTVGILGRTNSGKSTLLNSLINKKIAATAAAVNTTRKPVSVIWNFASYQLLLLDAPGTCQVKTNLDRLLFRNMTSVIEISDCIWWLIDVNDPWEKDNQILANLLKNYQKPVFLLINKIDLVSKDELLPKIACFAKKFPFQAIVPLSAKKRLNFVNFQKMFSEHFLAQIDSNFVKVVAPDTFVQTAREVVREQVILQTSDELPHQTAILVDNWNHKKQDITFYMTIFVATQSQKAIVLGKNGHKIKEIRMSSQKNLENLYKKPVFLFLKVKIQKKWYQDLHFLQKLDLSWKGVFT